MFGTSNSQQAAQFGINPFQRIEIAVGNIDRSAGVLIPEPQGVGFYVERADYPVIVSLVNPATDARQSFVVRDGLQITAQFKGLYLTHPFMNAPAYLSIITFATCDALASNGLATPSTRFPLAYFVTGAGAFQIMSIFVPPGVRALNNLCIANIGSAPTACTAAPIDSSGTIVFPPTNIAQIVAGFVVTYNGGNSPIQSVVPQVLGPNIISKFDKIVLPSRTVQVNVTLTGTAVTGVVSVSGWFE